MPAKKPQDHKKPEGDSPEKFRFESPNGDGVIEIPSLGKLPMGILRRNRNNEMEAVFAVCERFCDDDQLAILDELNAEQFSDFLSQWGEFSGVSLGELMASSR